MNIVLVSFKYPPIYSGYGKQLQLVTENLLQKDNTINIKVLTAYNESSISASKNLEVNSLLNKTYDNNSKSVFPFSKEVFKWLIKNRKSYDVIHCVKAGPEAVVCNLISKLLKKPLIVKVAQDELSDEEINSASGINRLTRILRHKLLKSVNVFIAISEDIGKNLKKKTQKKSHIARIPNGVDTISKFYPIEDEKRNNKRRKLSIPDEELVLLYAGAINRRKGIHDLLEALKQYDSKQFLRVILCGPILENINFEEKLKEINYKKNIYVDYRGKVANVDEYMKVSDMFILPSYSEGLPNVLLEAGATGLPLIATDINGSRDIVLDNQNGYIVSTSAPTEIKEKIVVLVENKKLREKMGRNSRKFVENSFSLNKVCDAYLKLYRELSN